GVLLFARPTGEQPERHLKAIGHSGGRRLLQPAFREPPPARANHRGRLLERATAPLALEAASSLIRSLISSARSIRCSICAAGVHPCRETPKSGTGLAQHILVCRNCHLSAPEVDG